MQKATRAWRAGLTVDGNGNAFAQNIAIRALEGRDLVEGVQLEVLGLALERRSIDILDVELVRLGHGTNAEGAGVGLPWGLLVAARQSRGWKRFNAPESNRSCQTTCWVEGELRNGVKGAGSEGRKWRKNLFVTTQRAK
jgi:hypothetical protein